MADIVQELMKRLRAAIKEEMAVRDLLAARGIDTTSKMNAEMIRLISTEARERGL